MGKYSENEEWKKTIDEINSRAGDGEKLNEYIEEYKNKWGEDKEESSRMLYLLGFEECQDYFQIAVGKVIKDYIDECNKEIFNLGFNYCIKEVKRLQAEQQENKDIGI